MHGIVKKIEHKEAINFLLPKHYMGRKPNISEAFGWFFNNELKAVCTFGKPASPFLCRGICGEQFSNQVYELNRLCRTEDLKEPLSQFVSACLRQLRANNWIIVSFSDMAMQHHGYIYQACNFIYTGCTKERTDKFCGNGKHPRHYNKNENEIYRLVRSPKHRYIFFCTFNKNLKKQWKFNLKYPVMPYPKGDNNSDYELGNYLKPKIIKV